MEALKETYFREQLRERKGRLERAQRTIGRTSEITRLLSEVDSALGRIEKGTFGLCESCHDTIEADRLLVDPLARFCLDHLTGAEQRALEHDLGLAAKVQGSLLPQKQVRARGWEIHHRYEPLGPVSGDYCDVVEARDGDARVFALMGDASGKGVSASILMAQLHATFRSLIPLDLTLPELMDRANRIFCESAMSSHYATLVCARASSAGDIEIVNAGHPPPLLVRKGEVSKVGATGLPMGIFCGVNYAVTKVSLGAGDSLVLYTDGITETKGGSGDEYGVDRLVRILGDKHALPAELLLEACLDDIAAFRGATPRTDDLAAMLLRKSA